MSVLSTTALDTFVNGASNGSTAVANTLYNGAADDLVVFQLGGSMQFSGRLMRAIIASGAIDSTDRASLDTWLNAAF
jgi:spore maturation protein SpmB